MSSIPSIIGRVTANRVSKLDVQLRCGRMENLRVASIVRVRNVDCSVNDGNVVLTICMQL